MPSGIRQRCLCPSLATLLIGLLAAACSQQPAPPHDEPSWPTLPLAAVPYFMHETLFERVRFTNTEPLPVYGYSLVVNLHNTGDSGGPTFVRQYIERQIVLQGFSELKNDTENITPQGILSDKRVAIVEVEADIPAGARYGQRIDVNVHGVRGNHIKSLAHGFLYQCALGDHGEIDPDGITAREMVDVPGGQIYVNPSYALTEGPTTNPSIASSLQHGIVMDGAIVKMDRPILLQIRQPQLSTARRIEQLIQERWQDTASEMKSSGVTLGTGVAQAQDEGLVFIYLPPTYKGDWKHFVGVVSHLFMNNSQAFSVAKAHELVNLAHQPNAPLADISLCWEAMGADALPIFQPLVTDPDPQIAYAAARAAAYCGDSVARQALMQMASDPSQPNQLQAVQTLGELPASGETTHMLRTLLDSDKTDIRIAAYRILASEADAGSVQTIQIGDRFFLDLVESRGAPMVYATTTGVPRIALIGHNLTLHMPLTFAAMNYRFTISTTENSKLLTMFYRDPEQPHPTVVMTGNSLSEIVARLGGKGAPGEDVLDLSFGDIVALLQQMVNEQQTYGTSLAGDEMACTFDLEHPQLESDSWTSIPHDTLQGRPQGTPASAVVPATRRTAPIADPAGMRAGG